MSLLLLMVLLPGAASWAQADLHDWNNVKNIAVGSDIWIKGTNGNVSGAFESADDLEIHVREWRRRPFVGGSYSRPRVLRRDEVRQVRFAKRAWSAVAGGAIGVAVGAGIGAGLEAQYSSHEDGHLAAAVLGFFGGLIGEGVGEHTAFVHGQKIYVRK